MRTMNTAAEQEIAIKELEVQALRTAILQKHADLVRIKNEKVIKVKYSDDLLRGMNRNPHLPVEVILRIFELLYYPQSVDFRTRSTQDLALYQIASGFEDLPGWRKAILGQIPLVLAPESRQWDSIARELSLRNRLALGHYPRLCAYNNNNDIAQVGAREPAAAFLAINSSSFRTHLSVARHFKIKSLILSASNFQRLSEGLNAAGELLWRIEALEIVVNKNQAYIHDEFPVQQEADEGPLRISFPIGGLGPTLRFACLPWDALQACLPLLAHVTSLELVIPSEATSNISEILSGFHSLPQSITHLTFRQEFRPREVPILEDVDDPTFLPNLVELAVKGFESRLTNLLIKGLDSPNLASLAAKPDISTSMFDPEMARNKTSSKEGVGKIHFDFLELAHKKFHGLKRLNYAPPESAVRTIFLSRRRRPGS